MTWSEAKARAQVLHAALVSECGMAGARLVLRALSNLHHTKKELMQVPTIIVAQLDSDRFQVDVSGRFGGGFRGLICDRAGVLARLAHLKSYDCGEEPASVIVPESLKPEFAKVFPASFK